MHVAHGGNGSGALGGTGPLQPHSAPEDTDFVAMSGASPAAAGTLSGSAALQRTSSGDA